MKKNVITLAILTFAVSACSDQGGYSVETSRMDNAALMFFDDPIETGPPVDQADALRTMADDLVRASTLRGAGVGAVAGCGLAIISENELQRCVVGAIAGGAGGALIGAKIGERNVARRVAVATPEELSRKLIQTQSQLNHLKGDLPKILAHHENTLNKITVQYARGELSDQEHRLALLEIEKERSDLTEALTISARDLRAVERNIQSAVAVGQSGLEWHMTTAQKLSADVGSMRNTFDTF